MMTPWKKRKLLKMFAESFGKEPDKEYFPGDMGFIRTFYDACLGEESDQFHVDETTWKDLNMEDIYQRVNACQCTAGEQYLYYMLRTPMSQANYLKQHGLIHVMETQTELRLKLQLILCRISSSRHVDLTTIFQPRDSSSFWLIIYCLMALLLPISIIAAAFLGSSYIVLPIAAIIVNSWFHTFRWNRCEHEISRVNYCVSLILALNHLRRQKQHDLDPYLSDAYEHLNKMKPILRSGPVMTMMNADMLQAAAMVTFMIDLISFEILRKRLAKYHYEFLAVHKAIGQIDASIAIASYRAGLSVWCEPEINFGAKRPDLRIEGMVHPLLKESVPNDVIPEKSMLITGSNASGKSTYLRTAMICTLLAQTICTCTCRSYIGSSFRI